MTWCVRIHNYNTFCYYYNIWGEIVVSSSYNPTCPNPNPQSDSENSAVWTGLPWSLPNADQYWGTDSNANQFLTILNNVLLMPDWHWLALIRIDWHWSAMIGIRHWWRKSCMNQGIHYLFLPYHVHCLHCPDARVK